MFKVEGVRTIQYGIKSKKIKKIFIGKNLIEKKRIINLINEAKKENIPIQIIEKIDVIEADTEFKVLEFNEWKKMNLNEKLILILDQIEDVGNLGSIIRSSAAFNVDTVFVTEKNSASVNKRVVEISSGSCLYINVVKIQNVFSIISLLKEKNFWIYGCDSDGNKIFNEVEYFRSSCFVIGNEHFGIRKSIKKMCDFLIKIPINKNIGSLNAAVSAAIILGEACKIKMKN